MKKLLSFLLLVTLISTSALSQTPAPVIWNGSYAKFLPQIGWKLFDLKEYRSLVVDPTAGLGVAAPIGSIGVRDNAGSGEIWAKVGASDTAWSNVLTAGSGWSLLGNTGTNDTINFLGTTDAQDLVIKTNNTEWMRISDVGGFVLQPTDFLIQGNIGAIPGDYNQLFAGQTFTSTIGNNYYGPYVGPSFQGAITGNYNGYSESSTFQTGSSASSWYGLNIHPQFQSGSTVGNIAGVYQNPSIAAGTLVGGNYGAFSSNPNIASNFDGYGGYVDQPTISGVMANGYNGFSEIPQFGATSSMTSNFKAFQVQPSVASGATFTSGTGYFSGATVASGVAINDWTAFQDSSDIDSPLNNYVGLSLNPQGSGDVTTTTLLAAGSNLSGNNTSVTGLNVNGTIGNNVTNYNGAVISPTATGTVTNITGVSINNSGLNSPNQKSGLSINDGSLSVSSNYDTSILSPSLSGIGGLSFLGGTFQVSSGFPVTGGGAMLANNLAINGFFQDDMPVDLTGGLIGFTSVGYVGQMSVLSGKTVDHINMALAGAGVPASSTGGAITTADMYSAAGFLNQGGTLAVGTVNGFHGASNLCSFGTACYGVKIDATAAENSFAKSVVIGGSAVSNADTAFDIGSLKALRNSRLTTAQRNALAPLSGMQIYNTTTSQLEYYNGSSWVASSGSNVVIQNTVWVDKSGNDGTCVANSINFPCLTVAQAMTLVTAPASGNRWRVQVGVGTFTEATLTIKPWTWIAGTNGQLQGGQSRISVTAGNITLDAGWSTGSQRGGLANIYLTGTTGFNADLVAIGATASHVFEFFNVGMNGTLNMEANSGTLDFLDVYGLRVFGGITLSGGSISLVNSQVFGNSVFDNIGSQDFDADYYNSDIEAPISAAQSLGKAFALRMTGNRLNSTLTATGTAAISADAVSLPTLASDVSLSGGATVTLTSEAYATGYSPGVPANWSPTPANVHDGLDQLAASIAGLGTNYLYKPGISGGQTATGGTAASNNLVLRSTTNATKGQVYLDETTASTTPTTGALRVDGGIGVGGAVNVAGAIRSNTSLVLEDPGAGTNTTTIQAGTVSASYSVTLPTAQGAANTTLVNDGTGALSWTTIASTLFGSRSSGRSIVAGTGITSGGSDMSTTAVNQTIFVTGSGGVDITASPQIQAHTVVGAIMKVCGTSDSNYVNLDNGTGLSLNGSAMLGKDDCITLMWGGSDGTTSDYIEISRSM